MKKIIPANPRCDGCFYIRTATMEAPCVHCSRAFNRVDMYWKGEDNNERRTGEENNGESNGVQIPL